MTSNNGKFINEITSRFLRHLGSIERLQQQNVEQKPEPSKMDIGEFTSYVLHLKYKKVEAEKNNDIEKQKELEKIFKELEEIPVYGMIDKNTVVKEEDDTFTLLIESAVLSKAYDNFMENTIDASYDQTQFQNSLIVSLVIGLELLIADIFKDFIHNLDVSNQVIKDKPLTYYDLKNIGSIEDAKTFLLDQYIENLLRNSFEEWIKELDKKVNINLHSVRELKEEIILVTETLQRRHLIIHNDGKINDLYINKIDPSLRNNLIKGETLELDDGYIQSRISVFRKFGLILIYLYGLKKYKNSLDDFFYDYHGLLVGILDKDCGGVRFIFDKFSELNLEYSSKLMSKINYFLSYKLNKDDSVDDEIDKFDTSALSVEYRMAKNILIGDDQAEKDALEFFKSIDDDYFISVMDWPLIKLLNKTPAIKRYIKRRYSNIVKKEMSEEYETAQ
ncbi:hypothetical protein MHZ92_18425 [Sporosarcina sp. ACRSL]|uniref:hypothetical protein n=1 Tax=Sporosarcina sp. ACRSL TaxID=2918215 RepID=UPI001EF4230C|nr:hypothetical protein [Sporosarcina sp. ACRSL]MCG7346092.1 hypothetical protein [Sporosarcina sp. ACRSL]